MSEIKEKTILDKEGEAGIIRLGKPITINDKKVRFVRWDPIKQEYLFYCNPAGRRLQPIT